MDYYWLFGLLFLYLVLIVLTAFGYSPPTLWTMFRRRKHRGRYFAKYIVQRRDPKYNPNPISVDVTLTDWRGWTLDRSGVGFYQSEEYAMIKAKARVLEMIKERKAADYTLRVEEEIL